MSVIEITLIGIFTIEAIQLIITIVRNMEQYDKIPFSDNINSNKDDFYV